MVVSSSLNRGINTTDSVHQKYTEVVSPHIDSFDSFVRKDIRTVVDSIEPVQVRAGCSPRAGHAASPLPCHTRDRNVTLADSTERPGGNMDSVALESTYREASAGRGGEAPMPAKTLQRDGTQSSWPACSM